MSKNKPDSERCAYCKGRVRKVEGEEYNYECVSTGMLINNIEYENPVIREEE